MSPNVFGIAGALHAIAALVVLEVLFPRHVNGRDEPHFTSSHGGRAASPRERMIFRLGLSGAAALYLVFAIAKILAASNVLNAMPYCGAAGSALALLGVAWIEHDAPVVWRPAAHALCAITFFTLSVAVEITVAASTPPSALQIAVLLQMPLLLFLFGTSIVGVVHGRAGLAMFHQVLPANLYLRRVETLAAVCVAVTWLLVALPAR